MGESHLHDGSVTIRAGRGRHAVEHTAGRRPDDSGCVVVFVSVDPDDEVNFFCKHCHAFIPLPEGRGRFGSGKRRQDCDGTRPARTGRSSS